MTDSQDKVNGGSKNTFLSRVFGVHSSAVENSLDAAEMSHITMPTEQDFSNYAEDEGNVRLIESDQEPSSSNEDSNDEEPLIQQPQSIRFDTASDGMATIQSESEPDEGGTEEDEVHLEEEDFSDQDLASSVSKYGQPSSSEDEEPSSNSDSNRGSDETIPFIGRQRLNLGGKNPITGTTKSTKNPSESRVFERLLGNNPAKMFRNNGRPNNLEESFLFRKPSVAEQSGPGKSTHFNLKPPPIFNNISTLTSTSKNSLSSLSPKERALWKWANIENLDTFLQQVYEYYLGNGFYCIITEKVIHLATILFVVFISTYMGHCIDYSRLSSSHTFEEIHIEQCYKTQISPTAKVFLWIFYAFIGLKVLQLYFDVKALKDIRNFYNYLLSISDKDLQTIPWQSVIQQLVLLKDQNAITANATEVKAKNRLSAHDVANRIMRKENFVIALYDNNILDLSLPVPLLRTCALTKTLEWNINLCILGFAFNEKGYLKQAFLRESQREYLGEELKKRFVLAGFLNIILSPFLVTYFVLLNFFRYFNEYKTSPGSIGSRQYTPIAEWKFREYNELYHIFQKRMRLSMIIADNYVNQFPNTLLSLTLSFIQFVSGSFVAILGILTIFDPDNFLNFEITPDRTVLFYMTVFGTLWAVCHSSINDEYTVLKPEETLEELVSYTHYAPKEWKGKYHTEDIKNEFCRLYNLRITLLLRELVSIIITPFILWFSLPKNSERIIDFFRECTVYEEGLGYVCKYAMFEATKIDKGTKAKKQTKRMFSQAEQDDSETESDEGVNKMLQSYMYFVDDYKNAGNAVGKNQLPASPIEPSYHPYSSTKDYSWKTQFALGKNSNRKRNLNRSRVKRFPDRSSDLELGSLSGSLINKSTLFKDDIADNADELKAGNGVMGLLNQYYKKSDRNR